VGQALFKFGQSLIGTTPLSSYWGNGEWLCFEEKEITGNQSRWLVSEIGAIWRRAKETIDISLFKLL